jgi:hypothetical protein
VCRSSVPRHSPERLSSLDVAADRKVVVQRAVSLERPAVDALFHPGFRERPDLVVPVTFWTIAGGYDAYRFSPMSLRVSRLGLTRPCIQSCRTPFPSR